MSACTACGKQQFPPVAMCPDCWSETDRSVALDSVGELYTYSELHIGAAGHETPYVVGFADFPGDVRVFAKVDVPSDEVAIGMPLVLTVAERGEDDESDDVVTLRRAAQA